TLELAAGGRMFLVTSRPRLRVRSVRRFHPFDRMLRVRAFRGGIAARRGAAVTARAHRMPFGAELLADGKIRFRLWAPPHPAIEIEFNGETMPMECLSAGWHELVTDRARAGTRYRFVLPDGLRVPDPASRYQPEDVHGPSEVVDPAAYD